MERLKSISLSIFVGLLAYMPFHIFLSTWLGSSFHLLEVAKVAKDVVLVIGFAAALLVGIRQAWLKEVFKDRLMWLIGAYGFLTLLMALIKPVDIDAEILGVVYNLRFFVFFIYGALLMRMYKPEWLRRTALKVVLLAALPVLVFGVVQYMWLPDNALTHIGYSRENGVLPAFHIDNKPDLERIMSTLRDPNSLGSYLIIILAIAAAYLLYSKNKDLKQTLWGVTALGVMCMYFTFSRGAWIGAVVMVAALLAIYIKQKRRIRIGKWLVILGVSAVMLLAAGMFVARDTYFVKNVILHADESTVLEDPNELRLRFWRESLEAAKDNPLGYGPGTAGLASVRNEKQGTILNENYYLQILHEVGITGLLLFLAIIGVVIKRLYEGSRNHPATLALLAALIGLCVTNFLVHIWSNEAVAYTCWGLAGLLVYGRNSDNKQTAKN